MTKKGAGAAKTATLKRRTFTREFKLQKSSAKSRLARPRRKWPGTINSVTTRSRSGAASCANIRSARLPVVVTPTLMKRASTNWN